MSEKNNNCQSQQESTPSVSRRDFMTTAGSLALGTAALSQFVSGAQALGAQVDQAKRAAESGKTYKVGLIGAGWYGKSDLFRLMQVASVEVLAIAEPDAHQLDNAVKLVSERQASKAAPKKYGDHTKMLAENQFDIVIIGSPDHWHALHLIDSVKAGADVYVQKPISRDVLEGEAMVAAAREHKKVVQVGTQRKSTPHLVQAKEQVVDAGLLGKIAHVDMCCYYHMRANGNPDVKPVPEFFDYETWTGPAPLRPYDDIPHVRWWRTFTEYGNGITGDMCIHILDTVRWMLKLGWPTEINSHGGIFVQKEGKSNISDTQTATFGYDGLTLNWVHRTWGDPADKEYPWSLIIYGDKGVLKASTMQADFIPHDSNGEKLHFDCLFERDQYPEDLTEKDIELNAAPATRAHMRDFVKAIEARSLPIADIEEGHISTASCILANISMNLGRSLKYDPKTKTVIGDEEATALLKRDYRAPYAHPWA